MSRVVFAMLSALTLASAACSDTRNSPTAVAALAGISADRENPVDGARVVNMHDECDPATFNAAFNNPNICVKQGHVTFDRFIAELTKTRQAGQWRFDPCEMELDARQQLFAINHGGEVHTFTRVAKYAGGIIPLLNDLTGNTEVAPECNALEADDLVAPGATYTAELNTDEIQHFQCCIHPWMKTDVRLKNHSS